ncbi:MAG: TrbG/VirB9 family P-type conjugative transfer protein [Alteraurantiacibacter sp.]
MTRALIAALLVATLASPALAQNDPRPDPRLVTREYDPDRVVRVEGRPNVQATIRFAEDETIQNVAIGDSQAWQVTPSRSADLLFVKPLTPRATTNMTVVTSKRVYLFDLVAGPAVRNPLYVLSFTYPVEEVAEDEVQLAGAGESANEAEMAAATDDLAVIDPATLNFAWGTSGAPALLPETVYDNGTATFLTWATGEPMPAILIKNAEGLEGPVNYATRGGVIVIDAVPGEIILRSGDDMARLVYNGPVVAQTGA